MILVCILTRNGITLGHWPTFFHLNPPSQYWSVVEGKKDGKKCHITSDACGHQYWEGGQPDERVKMSRIQVLAIRAVCHLLHKTYSEDFRSWFNLCNACPCLSKNKETNNHQSPTVSGTKPYKAILGLGFPLHRPYIQLI